MKREVIVLACLIGFFLVFPPAFIAGVIVFPQERVVNVSGSLLVLHVDAHLVNLPKSNNMNTQIRKIIEETNQIWERFGISLDVWNISSIKVKDEIARAGKLTGNLNKDVEELGEQVGEKFHDRYVDVFIIERFNDESLAGKGLVSGDKRIGAVFVSLQDFDPWVTAHELGHVLGLSDICTANLMIWDAEICSAWVFKTLFHPTNLTQEQVKTASGYVRSRFVYVEKFS